MSLSFEERKKIINKLLEEDGKVNVNELANDLEVSGETIRRDLERLEKDGILRKVYGGAIKEKKSVELPYDKKTAVNVLEKRAICKKAAEFVEDGDSIAIGHGTTPVEIVRYLGDKKNVTIITPSIPVLLLAMECFSGNVIFIGGELEANQKFTSGPLSDLVFSQLKADKAFMAAAGITVAEGFSDYSLSAAASSRKMMKRADEVFLLADHTRFGKNTFAHVCPLKDVSAVITDKICSEEWQNTFSENGIELVIANPEE
jgi:DeoR/GlpR family transcriptional regulator of sugar metabolism